MCWPARELLHVFEAAPLCRFLWQLYVVDGPGASQASRNRRVAQAVRVGHRMGEQLDVATFCNRPGQRTLFARWSLGDGPARCGSNSSDWHKHHDVLLDLQPRGRSGGGVSELYWRRLKGVQNSQERQTPEG